MTMTRALKAEDGTELKMNKADLQPENQKEPFITASTSTPPGFDRETKIYGSRGYAHLIETKLVELTIDGKKLPCGEFVSSGAATTNQLLDSAGHKRQISDFIDVINGTPHEYIDEHDGKRPVELIEKIYSASI